MNDCTQDDGFSGLFRADQNLTVEIRHITRIREGEATDNDRSQSFEKDRMNAMQTSMQNRMTFKARFSASLKSGLTVLPMVSRGFMLTRALPFRKSLLALMFGLSAASSASAAVQYDLHSPTLAATVDQWQVSQSILQRFTQIAQRKEDKVSPQLVLKRIIDNHLLASYARAHFKPEDLIEDSPAAYHPDVQIQQSLVSNIIAAYGDAMRLSTPSGPARSTGKGKTAAFGQTQAHQMTDDDWKAVFADQPKMSLYYQLTPAGRKAAEGLVLRRYRFGPQRTGAVTLAEVYDAQHVQGRNQIHQKDAAYVDQQAQNILEGRFAVDWLEHHSGLSATEVATFRQIVLDLLQVQGYLAHIGVAADIHDDVPYLKQVASEVSQEEVNAFYKTHLDMFERVERVKARHIQVPDEATAREVQAELKKGRAFAELAEQYSQADDKASGGDMGWVVHQPNSANWLESLLFFQPVNKVSAPVRMPGRPDQAVSWELVLVEQKEIGHQPMESSSVRYVASQAIARQKVRQEYAKTRLNGWQQAAIHVQPTLKLPDAPLAEPLAP